MDCFVLFLVRLSFSSPCFGPSSDRNELEFSEVLQLVKQKEWKLLCGYDQMQSQMAKQLVFAGFQEGAIRFAPTYRWERKENVFSNKKFQAPSWTDRVLWHSLPGLADLTLDTYSSAPNLFGSDHRPVFATFSLTARPCYTGKFTGKRQAFQTIRILENENTNLIAPSHAAFAPKGANAPARSSTIASANSFSSTDSSSTPTTSPPAPSAESPLAGGSSAAPAKPKAHSLVNGQSVPYKHFSLPDAMMAASPIKTTVSENQRGSMTDRATSSASVSGSHPPPATPSAKGGFTPYLFTPAAPGPLFTPPALEVGSTPMVGTTRDFAIVLHSVKCTFSTVPKGDFTLTASAPFLQAWPTTTAVSYPFGLEVGCHWEEIVLPPFMHDLYYLYTRHLMFSISVPSLAANTSGVNVEQTGTGTCIGTVSVALGSICARIFQHLATRPPTPLTASPAAGSPPGSGSRPVDSIGSGLVGDHGAYYFIEPIYREGLYAGQMEGRILFRYK